MSISLTIGEDFLVTSSTASQTVTAGQTSGPYALTVRPVGASFAGAVTLACTAGLPAGAQCVFNPTMPITPGTAAVDVVMNISTKASAHARVARSGYWPPPAIWLQMAAILMGICVSGNRTAKRARRVLGYLAFSMAMIAFASCAGVSGGGGGDGGSEGQSPPPATYTITVTDTSPGTPADAGQSTTVTLVVN